MMNILDYFIINGYYLYNSKNEEFNEKNQIPTITITTFIIMECIVIFCNGLFYNKAVKYASIIFESKKNHEIFLGVVLLISLLVYFILHIFYVKNGRLYRLFNKTIGISKFRKNIGKVIFVCTPFLGIIFFYLFLRFIKN